MSERQVTRLYQATAGAWLSLAILSLLLPFGSRLGFWLPLHLALAGAVSVAISGAIGMFSQVLTASPSHPLGVHLAQFGTLNVGAACAAAGVVTSTPWAVALGGILFLIAMLLLASMVIRARRRGLNKRHAVPLFLYLCAIACVVVGATIGAALGSGVVSDAGLYVGLRNAHLTLNVLGWASFAIIGTLITLFPSVLRVQMVRWRDRLASRLLVGGVFVLALGLALRATLLALLGITLYGAGAALVAEMIFRTIRVPRKQELPLTARHMVAALVWWLVGLGGMGIAIARSTQADGLSTFRSTFLLVFVAAWVLQTLAGTWLYLLPVWRPGSPEQRVHWRRAAEFGGRTQLIVANVGLTLLAVSSLGQTPGQAAWLVATGIACTLSCLMAALIKVFVYPLWKR